MSGSYAKGTSVPVERSLAAIQRRLEAQGCECFGHMIEQAPTPRAGVTFRLDGLNFLLVLPLPGRTDTEIRYTPAGKDRTAAQVDHELAKEHRRRYRALDLVIKAKLEAVATGISTLQREFMADLMLPTGKTIWQHHGAALEALAGSPHVPLLPEAP